MKINFSDIFTTACICLCSHLAIAQQQLEQGMPDTAGKQIMVSVAYDKVPARQLSYSTSTVYSKDLNTTSTFVTGNALYGKLTGLTLIQKGGEPGKDAPSLYLRGRSTTKTNTPIIVVDGIERDLNDVQLLDIESITVLKDAASTAIYGIKGANGVIVVTTKRGYEGKLKINGGLEQIVMTPTREPKFYNSADYVKLYNQALANDGLTPLYTQDQINGYASGASYFYPNVDWRDEVTKDYAFGTRANVNVSGGEKVGKYYVSLGYFNQGGIYDHTKMNNGYSTQIKLDNFFFRSNLDLNVNENWTFGLDLSGSIGQRNSPYTEASTVWDMLYKYPSHLFPVYVQDGVYGGSAIYPNNPLGYINSRGFRQINSRVINSTLFTRYKLDNLLKGLSVGARFSTDNFYSNVEGYTKTFAVKELLGKDANGQSVLSPNIGTNSVLSTISSSGYPQSDLQNKRNTFEANVMHDTSLGQSHTLKTQLIYHQERLIIGSESPYNYQFIAGRVNYGYKDRYFAELGASYSGTEAFPKGHRFGFFPSASAAWIISDEDFLSQNKAISFLKLYASAGMVGNSAVGERFSDLRQYVTGSSYNFGNPIVGQGGLNSGVLPNLGFTWETAYKYDAGINLQLFNKLDVALTYFFQKRKDILVPQSNILPSLIGATLSNINAGITHNYGFESSIGYRKQHKDWGYQLSANLSYVEDKVQYFPETIQPNDYLYHTGQAIAQPFMLEAIGFFNSDGDIASSPLQTFGNVKPGDIKYKDQNGDGRIDSFDAVPLENSTVPKWELGFNLGFNFKGFDFNAFFQSQLGRSVYLGNEPYLFWPLASDGGKISTYGKQFWTPQAATTADYPRLSTIENNNNFRESSFWYVNGDFLRLRSLSFGYTFHQKVFGKASLKGLRIYANATNLFTLDHLKYTDPEVLGGYPLMKSINFGLSLQF